MSRNSITPITPIRIQFKIDTKEKWDILHEYNLEDDPPENAIPKEGECAISISSSAMEIYCGVSPEIKWYNSFVLYDGPKSANTRPLYYFNYDNTEYSLKENDTFSWNTQNQKFETDLSSINLISNVSGIVQWNQDEEEWQINPDYILIPAEFDPGDPTDQDDPEKIQTVFQFDGGIYNRDLSEPSFAGQSLSFGNEFT
jgi:hypothetical protein